MTSTPHQQPRTGLRMLATGALTLVASASAAGVWLAGAGTALAPEPVRLTQELSGSTGAMGAGYYISTSTSATVLRWPGSWNPGSVAAGTPCSTINLADGAETTQVIQAYGSYRRCL